VRYHGILAPCASLRARIVPVQELDLGLPAAVTGAPEGDLSMLSRSDTVRPRVDSETRPRRLRWAALLQ
jgi:hypothetical protein